MNGARFEHGRQGQDKFDEVPLRNQNAAAPVYLLIIAFIPAAVALYVNCTRYTDFAHHGWDIVAGSLIGIMTAVFSFRWYHLPISQGAGWAWGARSRDRAFGIPVGTGSYVGSEGWSSASAPHRDVEAGAAASDGTMLTSPGVSDQAMDEHPFPVVDANGSAQPQLQR